MSLNSATVAAADIATAAQYNNIRKDIVENAGDYVTTTGSANAYVASLDAQITAYVTGAVYRFKANFVNTGAATLNINGIGAKTIKKEAGAVDLEYGDIASGQICEVTYDGTNLQLITLSGQKNPRGFAAVAGEDIDGTTTPQAVFISDGTNGLTAGRYYKGDADNYTDGRKRFDGFVKSNIATAASDFIITEGVVEGFSGLTPGEYYYLSTTAGGVTLTDTGILVGVAKSATAITIQKELKLYACGTDSWAVTANGQTKTITHNLGRKPKKFRVVGGVGGSFGYSSEGVYDVINAVHAGLYITIDSNQVQKFSPNPVAKILTATKTADQNTSWDATVTSTTDLTVVMTSANYSTSTTFSFFWEVWA